MTNELSFEVVEGRDKGKLIRIPDDGGSIGRKGVIALDERRAEDFHCQLESANGSFVVRDLATTIGTFVNGKKIREAALNLNDVISIGSTKLALVRKVAQVESKPSPEAPTPAAPTPQSKPTDAGEWFYKKADSITEVGPVSMAVLQRLLATKQLRESDLVRKSDATNWLPVLAVEAFAPVKPVRKPLKIKNWFFKASIGIVLIAVLSFVGFVGYKFIFHPRIVRPEDISEHDCEIHAAQAGMRMLLAGTKGVVPGVDCTKDSLDWWSWRDLNDGQRKAFLKEAEDNASTFLFDLNSRKAKYETDISINNALDEFKKNDTPRSMVAWIEADMAKIKENLATIRSWYGR